MEINFCIRIHVSPGIWGSLKACYANFHIRNLRVVSKLSVHHITWGILLRSMISANFWIELLRFWRLLWLFHFSVRDTSYILLFLGIIKRHKFSNYCEVIIREEFRALSRLEHSPPNVKSQNQLQKDAGGITKLATILQLMPNLKWETKQLSNFVPKPNQSVILFLRGQYNSKVIPLLPSVSSALSS
mgnify:CR=1 FL=1